MSFLANDILQFAGISFIVMGILKKFNLKTVQIFVISIGFSLAASYFNDFTFANMYLNQFLGHIFETQGQNIVSCFPLLNWFIVPVSGMLFAEYLIRCNDKDELYKRIIKPSCILTLIMLIVGFVTLEGMFSTTGGTVPEKLGYLHASLPDVVILIIVALFIASVFYFLSKKLSSKVSEVIKKTSSEVTVIYIIQWALILFLTYINQFLQIQTNLSLAIIVLLIIIFASLALSDCYSRIKRHLFK